MVLINFIGILFFVTCMVTVLYTLFFSIAGHFYRPKVYDNKDQYKRIAVFMPAYKEDEIILNTAKHALLQNYPSHRYDVYVIADSFKKETLQELRKLPLQVIPVSFEKSTKSKAINAAFNNIDKNYDLVVILDADNIMHIDFLEKVNAAAVSGCYAIQGHRIAKNRNTRYAVMDSISEEVNNHIMRKGQIAVGLSSSFIGSGMAFSYLYLKQVMAEIDAVGGFDKELEMTLIDDNHQIVYLEDAIVLDEKVQKPEVFANQRKRWVAAQFVYLKKYWIRGIYNLLCGKIDYANKVTHYALVPKVILLGILFLMIIINLLIPSIQPGAALWGILAVAYALAYAIAIPRMYWNKEMFQAMKCLPNTLWIMCKAMFQIKGANKQFIHTPHSANFEKTSV